MHTSASSSWSDDSTHIKILKALLKHGANPTLKNCVSFCYTKLRSNAEVLDCLLFLNSWFCLIFVKLTSILPYT